MKFQVMGVQLRMKCLYLLWELALWVTLLLAGTAVTVNRVYQGPMQRLIDSYRRSGELDRKGYYPEFFPDVTYFARHCDKADLTTQDSNDIIVPHNATSAHAADIMMTHGAVLLREILNPDTANELRAYLESRNAIQDQLSWFEKFWEDKGGRLSLGLGMADAPIIAKAMHEVGNHQTLKAVLEGIVGPDPAIVEISTLTTLQGARPQGTSVLCCAHHPTNYCSHRLHDFDSSPPLLPPLHYPPKILHHFQTFTLTRISLEARYCILEPFYTRIRSSSHSKIQRQ